LLTALVRRARAFILLRGGAGRLPASLTLHAT